jgi:hypothetical protein
MAQGGWGSASGVQTPGSVEESFARKRMERLQAAEEKQSKKPKSEAAPPVKAY